MEMPINAVSPQKMSVSNLKDCEIGDNKLCHLFIKTETPGVVQINFETVWLQGYVEDHPTNNAFVLDDKTGKVIIQSISLVEGDTSWISKGMHCLVLGTLIKKSPLTVKPSKIANLDNNPNHKTFWPLEVQELQYLWKRRSAEHSIYKLE